MQPIVFYDIPYKVAGGTWSPNTWKTRYALNYKKLAYTTTWIEYPDIQALYHAQDIAPIILRSGKPHYCLPVIHDPNTGSTICDSARIAAYLDETYPDNGPPIIPAGTRTLQKVFMIAYDDATDPIVPFLLPKVAGILRPSSEEFFHRTRAVSYGKPLADLFPKGEEEYTEKWAAVKTAFGKVDAWLAEEPGPFIMGDAPSFLDFMLAGEMQWFKAGFGPESELWKDFSSWHGGRWVKVLQDLKQYEGVDQE
ncbi:hypothetical protein C8F01DRAFT_1207457 [Mycena amicta]|nr:hypothetical protein C8F01DRAFT_1207457 [Mycena amicta]